MILNSLFTHQRTGNHPATSASRTDFQRDFDRIIFSASFRRLQNKTQVFPLPGSVFVHNRLTHSLEVSSVGRSLGSAIGDFIFNNFKFCLFCSYILEMTFKNVFLIILACILLCYVVYAAI